jgi:hypothetical protein
MNDTPKAPAEAQKEDVATPAAPPVAPEVTAPVVDQLALLKTKADTLGVTYSGNIGIDALREKINAKMNGEPEKKDVTSASTEVAREKTAMEIRQELFLDATRLVRVRITNMNPAKADLPGEIFTVSNRYVGEIKRYIPYGEQVDGWHVEKMLLDMLKEKKFQQIRTKKGLNGQILPDTKWVREFAIEELPALTPEELKVLANKQAAAAGMGA